MLFSVLSLRHYYMGNYMMVILFIFLCVLYKKPKALVAVVATLKMWDWVRSSTDTEVGRPTSGSDWSQHAHSVHLVYRYR